MKLQFLAPMALLLLAACATDMTTAAGPGPTKAEQGMTDHMERGGGDTGEPHRLFRRPSYPRRDS